MLYQALWDHARGHRARLVFAMSLLAVSQLFKLALPWLAAQAIASLQGGDAPAALAWVGAIGAAIAASWALHGPGRVIERGVAVAVRRSMVARLYDRVTTAPLAWHERRHPGELQHRLGQSSQALFDFAQNQFVYLQAAIGLVGPLVALAWLSPAVGVLAAVGVAAVATVLVAFDAALMRLAQTENAASRRHASALLDGLSNITTVLSLGFAPSTRRRVLDRLDDASAPLGRTIVLTEWKWCAVDLLSAALAWALVVVYAWRFDGAAAALLGGIFMVHQYAQQAGSVVGTLAGNLQGFARMKTDFAAADEIEAAPRRTDEPAATLPRDWQRIDVHHLDYTHRDAAGDDLGRGGIRDVSLGLVRGERVALVGPSGSGKSTLLRTLAGLYEARHGHVEVDGVVPLGLRSLAPIATFIPQDAQVFEGTVRDNLCPEGRASDAALAEAGRVGGFDAVLEQLPDGLGSAVAAAGQNLSGGQRQRLCLARGVLAARAGPEASLLLLDEPTSALDALSEALVHRRLDAAFPDACIVASVHRMSLLAHFDRVVLMAGGRVVDVGSVDALCERQPMFRALLSGQAEDEPQTAAA